jgi:hypothetical protein
LQSNEAVKTIRLKLGDGTRLGKTFSRRVWDALDRAFWLEGLPPLRRNYVRFQASDKSIHDIPRRFISEALGIDQHRCYAAGRPQNFRILENAALRRFDSMILRQYRQLAVAVNITLGDGTRLSAKFSQRVWAAQGRQDRPQKHDKQILRTFRYLLMAAQNRS